MGGGFNDATCRPNASVASFQADEAINTQSGILIVGRDLLLDLPGVSFVRARAIVCECLRPRKLVVATGSCNNVSMSSNLSSKALYWAGHCGHLSIRTALGAAIGGKTAFTLIDFTKDYNTGKLGFGVVRDGRMEEKDAYLCGQNTAFIHAIGGCSSIRISPPCFVGTSTWLSCISIVVASEGVVYASDEALA